MLYLEAEHFFFGLSLGKFKYSVQNSLTQEVRNSLKNYYRSLVSLVKPLPMSESQTIQSSSWVENRTLGKHPLAHIHTFSHPEGPFSLASLPQSRQDVLSVQNT